MKLFKMKSLSFALLWVAGLSMSVAHAQTNLEYPGGPHSGMSDAEVKKLDAWAQNTQLQLTRLENEVSFDQGESRSDSEIKKKLYDGIKEIAGDSGLKPGDLLLHQSLYAGITLCDIIDVEGLKKGATPGEIGEQVSILKQTITMAKKYYISDQVYVNGLLERRPEVHFNNQLIEFGVELTQFMMKQSRKMIAMDASASYGMIKWSLGVLNRKILDDDRNVAFANTITYLNQKLGAFPEMENLSSDVDAIAKIRDLKNLAKEIFSEIAMTQKSLVQH